MKSILLIGLGRFGKHVALKLNELRHEVLAIDKDEDRVNEVLPYVTSAQIGDSTNEQFIASLGVRNFDLCIVAIGDNFLKLSGNGIPSKGLWRFSGRRARQPGCACQIPAAQRRRPCHLS